MTNNQYNKLLMRLSKANQKRAKLLSEVEEEFKKRYGSYPSDLGFCNWIDEYHYGLGFTSIEDIDKVYRKQY